MMESSDKERTKSSIVNHQSPIRIAVTGAAGFLGWNLCRILSRSHQVVALVHENPLNGLSLPCFPVDLADAATFEKVLEETQPQALVHSAAYCDADLCERNPELALSLNGVATRKLVTLCNYNDIPIFYISTDLVFDGQAGLYREQDIPRPISAYGRSKRAGELAVLEEAWRGAVLRCALMYGPTNRANRCCLTWLEEGLRARKTVPLFTDQYRSLLYVEDVAAALERLLQLQQVELFHVGGPERIDRYNFGLLFADTFGYKRAGLLPTSMADVQLEARRGADCSINIDKLRKECRWNPASPREGLLRLKKWRRGPPHKG